MVKIPWDCLFGRGDTGDQRGLQIQAWDPHLIPEWNVLVAGHFPDGWSSGCPLFLILKAPELGCERGERALSTQSLEGHPPGAGGYENFSWEPILPRSRTLMFVVGG